MTTIKLKNGSGAPTAGDLVQGEPALDLTNKRLYTEDSGGTVIEVGTNPGEDVTFADDRKAVFGAGSDLEIYHESSTGRSFIKETGADEFRILGSNIRIKNGGDSKTYMQMTDGGSVAIRHDDSTKLETTSSGIDVTGTVTADGLTVDGDAQINSAFPRIFMMENDTTDVNTSINSSGGDLKIFTVNDAKSSFTQRFNIDHATGDISFYEDTGTTAKLFWDASAESLGIGTSSPSGKLDVYTSANRFQSFTTASADLEIVTDNNTNPAVLIKGTGTADLLNVFDNTTEVFTILDGGNVGIGTSSPSALVDVNSGAVTAYASPSLNLLRNHGGQAYQNLAGTQFYWNTSNGSGESEIVYGNLGTSYLRFLHNNAGSFSEAMRIDSSGNLLVGTASPNTTANVYAEGSSSNAFAFAADKDVSSAAAAAFSRPDDGSVILFYRAWAGSGVGSISVTSTTTAYNTSSDQRLKENIVDAPSASDDIDAIQVRSFDWKVDGSHQKYGMVAQELVTVAPEAVSAPEDPEEMMGVDYSKLVPMMLKEIQSLRARVAQLEGAN